jgi:hypothetical protein
MLRGADADEGRRRWEGVVNAMRDSTAKRRVFSSEFLSDATDAQISRIIEQLGDETTVVLTLRPLAAILPSQYQQYVRRGTRVDYARWLDAMLLHSEDTSLTPSFWVRHRHDELARRWEHAWGLTVSMLLYSIRPTSRWRRAPSRDYSV